MANIGHKQKFNEHKIQIICSANKLFLQKGYTLTTIADIAKDANVDKNAVFYIFKDKETLLSTIVKHVLECQYAVVNDAINNLTDNKLLRYAVEVALQLHVAESSEYIREMYNVSYSLSKPSEVIYNTVTEKLYSVFSSYNPSYEMKDFYELELAVGGVMRSFMTVPCDMYFTINRKVKRFLEVVFSIFHIKNEDVIKALEFTEKFNYQVLTEVVMNKLPSFVEGKVKETL